MTIYYWSVYRPTLIPAWLIFLAGLCVDVLTMMPLGVNALTAVVTKKVISRQRPYLMGQSFIILWLGFVVVQAAALVFSSIIYGVISDAPLALNSIAFSWIASALCFPFITMALHMVHKILPSPDARKSISLHRSRGV